MGATCVRQCERTEHELTPIEDLVSRTGIHPLSRNGTSETRSTQDTGANVKVGTSSSDPISLINGRGLSRNSDDAPVPKLESWFQVAQNSVAKVASQLSPRDTPRFNEVTPLGSPRDSPRPPDERGGTAAERTPHSARVDEISYEGTYLDSMKHGTGRLQMNGSVYEGDFRLNLKHGTGVLTWDDGRQYRGQFQEGKFYGSAVMTWPDGRKYTGQYVEDRKHGEGTFSWQDGRRYQGQWIAGKRHGVGVYTNAKGITRTGTWNMDRPLHWEQAPNPSAKENPLEVGKVLSSSPSNSEKPAEASISHIGYSA